MSLLENYYAGINAENAAKTAQTYSSMRLTDAQVGQVGLSGDAARALQGAQAAATTAQAGKTAADTAQVAPTAAADQRLSGARATQLDVQSQQQPLLDSSQRALQGAQAVNLGATTSATLADLPGFAKPQGFAKGGTVEKRRPANAVPGKGKPGPTDTVPTMLAPGEGVLNKGAMEHYGSDVLDHMNEMGLMRMGAQSEVAKGAGLKDPHAAPKSTAGGKDGAKGEKGKAAGKAPPAVIAHGKGPAQSLFTLQHLQSMGS